MSVADAKRAAEIGCAGIVLSNHGGRQLDGSRAPFDQLAEVVDAVGDRIDVLMDGGVKRGTHVLKALSLGAKAVGIGRYYLYPLAAAGQAGVERALGLLQSEIERDMRLMGCTSISQLTRDNLRLRWVLEVRMLILRNAFGTHGRSTLTKRPSCCAAAKRRHGPRPCEKACGPGGYWQNAGSGGRRSSKSQESGQRSSQSAPGLPVDGIPTPFSPQFPLLRGPSPPAIPSRRRSP